MKKIASLLLNWNCEPFVSAHIEMIKPHVDKILVVQATRPWRIYANEHNVSDIPDKSEEIIRTKYPEIEIHYFEPQDSNDQMFHSNQLNFGASKLTNYDLVIKWDFDQLFTQADLKTIFKVLHTTNYNQYALDWHRHSINYHMDFDHGVRNEVETDPFAFNPKYEFGPLLSYPFFKKIIDEDVTQHHFRGFRPWVTQDWIDFKVASRYGVWAKDLVERYTPNNKWIKAPEEIRDYFRKTDNYFNL